jgi:FkbM family methyltransferase
MMRLAKLGISAGAQVSHRLSNNVEFQRMMFNSIRLNRTETERFRQSEEWRFLAYVFANRHRSSAQILQDLWVCYQLGEKRRGVFVEFGATNGRVNSNTWLLEEQYGWTGILAEPNPVWHADLKRNRTAAIDLRCVHLWSGRSVMFTATDSVDPELSGISDFAAGEHFAEARARGSQIAVETVSLNQLLDDHRAPPDIDYLSIDTEGSEYAILSEFDFDRRHVSLISVEQNPTTEPAIEALLTRNGYTRVFKAFSQWDGWYVRGERAGGGLEPRFEAACAGEEAADPPERVAS